MLCYQIATARTFGQLKLRPRMQRILRDIARAYIHATKASSLQNALQLIIEQSLEAIL